MSSAQARLVTIATEQEAYDLLRSIISNEIDAETIVIDFTSATWAKFSLKLTGSEFNSSLPASVMRSLVNYQNTLYRVAAYVRSDKLNGNALPDIIKENLELNFRVSEGSSEVIADAIKAVCEMVGKVTEGMSGRAKAIVALSALLMIFGTVSTHTWIDTQAEIKKANIEALDHNSERDHALETIKQLTQAQAENQRVLAHAYEQEPKLAEIQKQFDEAREEILRQSSRADTVDLQGTKIDGETARAITHAKRSQSAEVTIRGTFKVEEAADTSDSHAFICKVKNLSTGEVVQATMLDSLMSARDQEIVLQAFSSRQHVILQIDARKVATTYKDAKIVAATLVPLAPEPDAERTASEP